MKPMKILEFQSFVTKTLLQNVFVLQSSTICTSKLYNMYFKALQYSQVQVKIKCIRLARDTRIVTSTSGFMRAKNLFVQFWRDANVLKFCLFNSVSLSALFCNKWMVNLRALNKLRIMMDHYILLKLYKLNKNRAWLKRLIVTR